MKAFAPASFTLLLILMSLTAHADSIPFVSVTLTTAANPAPITSFAFQITTTTGNSPGTSGCILTQEGVVTSVPNCVFVDKLLKIGNRTHKPGGIDELWFNFPTPIYCSFGSCVGPIPRGPIGHRTHYAIVFGFGDSLPYNGEFAVSLTGFPPNSTTRVYTYLSDSVPEPSTVGLFIGGLGVIFTRIRMMSSGAR